MSWLTLSVSATIELSSKRQSSPCIPTQSVGVPQAHMEYILGNMANKRGQDFHISVKLRALFIKPPVPGSHPAQQKTLALLMDDGSLNPDDATAIHVCAFWVEEMVLLFPVNHEQHYSVVGIYELMYTEYGSKCFSHSMFNISKRCHGLPHASWGYHML